MELLDGPAIGHSPFVSVSMLEEFCLAALTLAVAGKPLASGPAGRRLLGGIEPDIMSWLLGPETMLMYAFAAAPSA